MYLSGQCREPELDEPTWAAPGSKRKIAIMRDRARRGVAVCHPRDARIVYPLPGDPYRDRVVSVQNVLAAIEDCEETDEWQ